MKVLKFGGTSVGSAESLKNVKQIVESNDGQVIVAVSALGGVTNQLLEMVRLACAHDDSYQDILKSMRQRHLDVIKEVVKPEKQKQCSVLIEQFIDNTLAGLYSFLYLNQDLPESEIQRMTDGIVAHGEIMSSAIVTCLIDDANPFFSPEFIKTRNVDGKHVLCAKETENLICQKLGDCQFQRIVLQGFIAKDIDTGDITNLGRGGSDFTAALIAAALHAESLEIWTDVDGFMTADPRTNPDATIIPTMTYEQAQAMCDAGAKVIYAPTLRPVAELGIPVWVKNTFNPTARGTVIQ